MAGWEEVLAELVRQRGKALKRYAYLLCGNDEDADDLVQDALVRAFARPGRRAATDAEAYVRRIMLNRFLDAHRRRRNWLRVQPLLGQADIVGDRSAEVALEADVRSALAVLSPRQRACAVLRHYEDHTVPEIAALLGCRPGTVKRHLSEAHQRLGALLTRPDLEEEQWSTTK
ncbi:SigE family RNA polymerase sigma factor [Streptomyces sp. NPDC051976]|uniref:RNA polymerase sigma factor n=1 Tax=Streptomyces sp. NPDC051976 TaxID=3154947 RepID=UPI00342F7D21